MDITLFWLGFVRLPHFLMMVLCYLVGRYIWWFVAILHFIFLLFTISWYECFYNIVCFASLTFYQIQLLVLMLLFFLMVLYSSELTTFLIRVRMIIWYHLVLMCNFLPNSLWIVVISLLFVFFYFFLLPVHCITKMLALHPLIFQCCNGHMGI